MLNALRATLQSHPDQDRLLRGMRAKVSAVFLGYCWFTVPVLAALSYLGGTNWPVITGAAAGFAAIATLAVRQSRDSMRSRLTIVAAMLASWMLLIVVASGYGNAYILDAHMLFFVLMMSISAYLCWQTVIFATTIVFFHHFILNFGFPTLIWPSGSAGLAHFVIHCIYAVLTTAAAVAIAETVRHLMIRSENARAESEGNFQSEQEKNKQMLTLVESGVAETSRVMAAMSRGQWSARVQGDYDGALQTLRTNIHDTMKRLQSVFDEMAITSQTVRGSAEELTRGTDALHAQAATQATSVKDITATTREVTALLEDSSSKLAQARSEAHGATEQANQGSAIVRQAIDKMAEIDSSASQVAEILNVIGEIAFQTNLLALNASVEAARAGDQGKGFAVVANEVRELSLRVTSASQEVQTLIGNSTDRVSEGVALVNQAGNALNETRSAIEEVGAAIESVAQASVEQTRSMTDISEAIANIDAISSKTSAIAEQSAESAKSFLATSRHLDQLIEGFSDHQGADGTGQNGPPIARRDAA